jgi:signal transduction histidine kinase
VSEIFVAKLDGAKHLLRERVTLDFRRVSAAFANSIVIIVAACWPLSGRGHRFAMRLPEDPDLARIFKHANWPHFLDPSTFDDAPSRHSRHLPLKRFRIAAEQSRVVQEIMEVVSSSTVLPGEIRLALEWSLQEITDNVMCHAESAHGGLVQVVTTKDRVQIVVGDAGPRHPRSDAGSVHQPE